MNSLSPILQICNLHTHFSTETAIVKAVDGINFDLFQGETLGVVGESGSGKSVTALSVMRLLPMPPAKIIESQILFQNDSTQEPVDLLGISEKKMQQIRGNRIGMIFQEPMTSLNPVFFCGDQIVEVLRLHKKFGKKEARDYTLHLFEKVKLRNPLRIFQAYPHQLSGGQKQRVLIAMALACNPDILIADEPTTALDVTVQQAILDLIIELKETFQMSVLFISHDLGVIAEIADRVLVMFKGKIVEEGQVEPIFKHPQHPYTRSLLACRPPLDFRLRKLPVVDDFMSVTNESGKEIQIHEKPVSLKDIIQKYKVPKQEIIDRIDILQQANPILSVRDLNTWYPSKRNFFGKTTEHVKAVNGVSFDLYPGEMLGLVGESGCGKTTLGRSIIRLSEPTSGEVFFQGKSLLEISQEELQKVRKDIQIIFQDPFASLNPRMTIGNAIMEPLKVHGKEHSNKKRKERAIELMENVQLPADFFNRYPHEFSGGQRQRICIARALALEPKLLICDECVSALDVSIQAQVLNLLMELREKHGLTYLFISHDLSVVKFMSDRLIVMNAGKIEEMGLADDIYKHPKKEYTRKLISAIPKGLFERIN